MIDDLVRDLHLLQKADSAIGKIWFNVLRVGAASVRLPARGYSFVAPKLSPCRARQPRIEREKDGAQQSTGH